MSTVYLIHFDRNLHHARHYLGWTSLDLDERIRRHRTGAGAALLRALNQLGIQWQVVRVWEDRPQSFERELKNHKNTPRLCPVCNPEGWDRRSR